MKTYISGPLAGLPEVSREEKVARFHRASVLLDALGIASLDPNEVTADCGKLTCGTTNGHTWDCWLRFDLIAMLQECDCIALLPGWDTSQGAILELHVARQLKWGVIDLSHVDYIVTGLAADFNEAKELLS